MANIRNRITANPTLKTGTAKVKPALPRRKTVAAIMAKQSNTALASASSNRPSVAAIGMGAARGALANAKKPMQEPTQKRRAVKPPVRAKYRTK